MEASLLASLDARRAVGRPNRNGAGRGDDQRLTDALLACCTAAQVDALLETAAQQARRTRRRRRPSRRAAGPGRVHHQPNYLDAGGVPLSRRPGTETASSIAAPLLSHNTIAQVDGLLPTSSESRRRLAVDSSALSGRRGGAAPGKQILGPTNVHCQIKLVRRSGCSVVLARTPREQMWTAARPWRRTRGTSSQRPGGLQHGRHSVWRT